MWVEIDAEHEVAEGAVDVLAAALHRRLVRRVQQVHSHRALNVYIISYFPNIFNHNLLNQN